MVLTWSTLNRIFPIEKKKKKKRNKEDGASEIKRRFELQSQSSLTDLF